MTLVSIEISIKLWLQKVMWKSVDRIKFFFSFFGKIIMASKQYFVAKLPQMIFMLLLELSYWMKDVEIKNVEKKSFMRSFNFIQCKNFILECKNKKISVNLLFHILRY